MSLEALKLPWSLKLSKLIFRLKTNNEKTQIKHIDPNTNAFKFIYAGVETKGSGAKRGRTKPEFHNFVKWVRHFDSFDFAILKNSVLARPSWLRPTGIEFDFECISARVNLFGLNNSFLGLECPRISFVPGIVDKRSLKTFQILFPLNSHKRA